MFRLYSELKPRITGSNMYGGTAWTTLHHDFVNYTWNCMEARILAPPLGRRLAAPRPVEENMALEARVAVWCHVYGTPATEEEAFSRKCSVRTRTGSHAHAHAHARSRTHARSQAAAPTDPHCYSIKGYWRYLQTNFCPEELCVPTLS